MSRLSHPFQLFALRTLCSLGTLLYFVLLSSAVAADDKGSCEKYVAALWPLAPSGDRQLTAIVKDIEGRYGKQKHYPTKAELFDLLYHSSASPYADVELAGPPTDNSYISNAQMNAGMLQMHVLSKLGGPPRFMLEVGSFVGSGLVHAWAPLAQRSNDSLILCVDTWSGDINMRLGKSFQRFMRLQHGFPTLQVRFLQRMKRLSLHETVFPLPMPSLSAARLLSVLKWTVDLVYLDSAHEIGETFAELLLYFQLVRTGGLLMGDDYDWFPAVKHDVDLFVAYKGPELTFQLLTKSQWSITKTNGTNATYSK